MHTPRGGVVAESWVLSFCLFFCFLFFWFLVFFGLWFCLAIAEKPSRNCQWLQSSERTMAHVQCQWLQNAVKNRTPRVSPSELLHTEDVLHRSFYTQKLLHKKHLSREVFTHRSFDIQKLLRKETFTHRNLYTQKLLHIELFGDGAPRGAGLLSLLYIVFFFGGCKSVLWSAFSITISWYVVTSSSSNLQDVPDTL